MPKILILTPIKDASAHLPRYFANLAALTYPPDRLSLGLLESDSRDGSFELARAGVETLRPRLRRAGLWRKDFGYRIPDGQPRWSPQHQLARRTVLAKSRNHLLFSALDDEDWVLWLDVDVIQYPADLIETLLGFEKDILHPHCVKAYGGPSFDHNAWTGPEELRMDRLRGGAALVRLDSVGGTALFVRADRHRDGLVFPPFLYGGAHPAVRRPGPWHPLEPGEIETEGLAMMARDMGIDCWGLPNLEIRHAPS